LEKPNEPVLNHAPGTEPTAKNDVAKEGSVVKSKLSEFDVIKKLKNQLLKEDSSLRQVFKKKKAKAPNPLSCKKKKTKENTNNTNNNSNNKANKK